MTAASKIAEASAILQQLGLPRAQQNERSALALLALLDLKPSSRWRDASAPMLGITPMMTFFAKHYGRRYAPNTRETVRRGTIHQFLQAGIIHANPDEPTRPTNSGKYVYQIDAMVLELIRTFGTTKWTESLEAYLASGETLRARYARERIMARIPIKLPRGKEITLSPGGQSVLMEQILKEFCPRFTPGALPVYVGDTGDKWAYFDAGLVAKLGVAIEPHGKMPDAAFFLEDKNWLVLIEAVTSHGPVDAKRHRELAVLFSATDAGLVFVTAFLSRRAMRNYLEDISWETEVWVAEAPSHLIHFNGERFLGPHG
jgi:hypothetical protein